MQSSQVRLTLLLGALTAFAPLSIDMYLPAFPALADHFRAEATGIQLTLSAFFIGLAAGQVLYGPASDRFGRKPPLYFGLALFIAASIGCALATTLDQLILWRFLQAVGGCAGMVIARAVVRDCFDAQGSAKVFSQLMLVMGVAPIVAPAIGAQILVWLGWPWLFWSLALFGAACAVATVALMPETLQPADRHGGGIGATLKAFAGLFGDRDFIGLALVGALASALLFAYISGSPFVFITRLGLSPDHFGWLFGGNALGLIAASQINHQLLGRVALRQMLRWAVTAEVVAVLVLLAAAILRPGLVTIGLPLFVCLTLLGFILPNAGAAAMAAAGRRAGSASALLGTIQFGLGAIAGGLVGAGNGGGAVAMAVVVAVCGLLARTALWFTEKKA
jgi:DHA1 family bicyclomycin/chloramphenicol resistance-like MFS transporter